MRVSRKFLGGVIAGGIMGAVIGVAMMPKMKSRWSMMTSWVPDATEMMGKQWHRANITAGKWRQ